MMQSNWKMIALNKTKTKLINDILMIEDEINSSCVNEKGNINAISFTWRWRYDSIL